MKMCKHCKEYLDIFMNCLSRNKKWLGYMDTNQFCKNQMVDNDEKVKSCLMRFNEKLSRALKENKDV